MKVRITFQELVSYEAVVNFEPVGELAAQIAEQQAEGEEMDEIVEGILEEPCEDGEPLWFHMLDQQVKDWDRMRVAGVDERNLTGLSIED